MKTIRTMVVMNLALGLGVSVLASMATANQPTQKDVDQMRDIIVANFDAQSNEDLQALMATFSHRAFDSPQEVAEFQRELVALFEETNLKVRLVSLHVYDYSPPSITGQAFADVVQLTLPSEHSYADLEEYPAEMSSFWRHNSASLPQWQLVKYVQQFDYDYRARRWKMTRIVSPPRQVSEWPENTREVMQGEVIEPTSRTGVK